MLASVQTPAWTYPSLTETTCTACECSAAAPSNGVLSSSIIEYSAIYNGALKEGGGGVGRSRKHCHLPIGIQYVFELSVAYSSN